ncbi:MAG TPA: hypothetical protein VM841_02565 [Actinomycetota bacterium]|nr:hypothetical protein [Actinomycetota bacterium]
MVDALDDLTLEELRELARIFKMNFRDETRLTKQDIILVLDEVNPGPLKDAVAAVRRRR